MKKLYRNNYDKLIGGVCSGIADYLEIDKSVIRLIAVFTLLLFSIVVFPTYVVAWLILPVKNY